MKSGDCLGLGQILDYRHRLGGSGVRGVLLVSRVLDPAWRDICGAVGIHLLDARNWTGWELA